jgi:hypothetical protein
MHILSKSSYMRGRQCPKALYLLKNRRELLAPVSAHQQAIFDQGTRVGDLACERFPGGIDLSAADHTDYTEALERTQQALATHDVLYEAAFMHEGVLAVLDILVRDGGHWRGIEVKSSTSAKAQFVEDAALQYHVITGTGLPLASMSIMHLDNTYVRQGPVDVHRLFRIQEVTGEVLERQEEVVNTVRSLKQMLATGVEPAKEIGPHCDSPYSCDFKAHCWKDMPVPSVLDLCRGRAQGYELLAQGIKRLEDIPADIPLTEKQQRQVAVHMSGIPEIDRLPIRNFTGSFTYPVHCLDLETCACAVPPFDGTRPYQAIPFQFSVHVIDHPGAEPRHFEYLADGSGDPRPGLVEHLLKAIGPVGTVLAYNLAFENSMLAQLALEYPQHASGLNRIISRCRDLAIPFANHWYYDRGMNGRYSIKQVLPALVPELSYETLEVRDGMMASYLFAQILEGRFNGDRDQWRQDMLKYCEMDTLAMVKLLQVLEREARIS